MVDLKVGFITPEDKIYWMTYHEVSDFCQSICCQEENSNKFHEFEKNYGYFSPYFDFVMFELEYIFINPLLEEGTCLRKAGNALYKISKSILKEEKGNYDSISNLAIRLKNGGNYADMVACSDKELKIRKCSIDDIHKCMIDPNGFTMISTSDGEKDGNHEVTSATIVNQLLMNSEYLWKTYNSKYYTASYLIEKFGFIRADSPEYGGSMIGVERFLTDEVRNFKNLCVQERNCVFYDLEIEVKRINEEIEDYQIKRR